MSNKCVIVMPWYKNDLTAKEEQSILSFNKYLAGKYPLVLVCPDGFIVENNLLPNDYDVKYFDPSYFESAHTYNYLLLSKSFYNTFIDFEYMLIHQIDAIIFKDALDEWCDKGYDYIGSPWYWDSFSAQKNLQGKPFRNMAGNGGFSLRKIDAFLKVLNSNKQTRFDEFNFIQDSRLEYHPLLKRLFYKTKLYFKRRKPRGINEYINTSMKAEDVFWGITATSFYENFRVATFDESIGFSFEFYPEKLFEINNKCLPFGAHAWFRYNEAFYTPYLINRTL